MSQISEQSSDRKHVLHTLGHWSHLQNTPSISLSEVQRLLERSFNQSISLLEFTVAEKLSEVNEPLASWLRQWDRTDYTDAEREDETFDYRLGNLEEDMMHIEELIEQLGGEFRFSDL